MNPKMQRKLYNEGMGLVANVKECGYHSLFYQSY